MKYTIRQIAEKNGCSPRAVQKTIKAHPELGIVTQERKKTLLTQHQASQLTALLLLKAQESADEPPKPAKTTPEFAKVAENESRRAQESAGIGDSAAMVTQDYAELLAKVARLEALLEVKDELVSSKDEEIARLLADRDRDRDSIERMTAEFASTVKQLESAEAKAERAQAEADSYQPSLFGFFRKRK